jgi:hypothetical protein
MSPPHSILVLGAGELGTAILEALNHHPNREQSSITVLLRPGTINTTDESKKKDLEHLKSLGIHFLPGDIVHNTQDELSAIFMPFHTVIGCTGMAAVEDVQVKIIKAILAAKVKRYIPWQFGVDYDIIGPGSSQDLFTEQLQVRALLRGQKTTSWIIISTGMFMSFLFEDFFGVVSADRATVRALGSWANEVTVTSVEDIGLMTAHVVLAEPELSDQVVFTAGDTISYGQLADVVERVEGSKVNREEWTIKALKDELAKDPNNGIRKYRVAFAEGPGVAWNKNKTLNVEKGIELISVEKWLLEQKT